ncbi:MAG TPA: hypothetical protein VHM90_16325, partial [Phycisphaerae bacterium]|nr:hypothetical protein [Phycisphaerae bacterium]
EAGATVRNELRMLALAEYATRLFVIAGTLSQSAILQNVARFTQLIGLVTLVLYYILLTRICRRIPHQPLARQFRRIMFGFSISLGVVLVLGLVMTMLPRGMGGGPGPALLVSALVACPALVALIVFGLWSFVAQVRLRRELAIVAITARARAGNPA